MNPRGREDTIDRLLIGVRRKDELGRTLRIDDYIFKQNNAVTDLADSTAILRNVSSGGAVRTVHLVRLFYFFSPPSTLN